MNIFNEIFSKNKDILERMDKKSVEKRYLSKEDVLLISLDKPVKDYDSIEINNGLVIVHYNSKYRITGFTIPYVKEFKESCHSTFTESSKIQINTSVDTTINPQTIASATMHYFSCAMTNPCLRV